MRIPHVALIEPQCAFGADFDPAMRLTFTIENDKAVKVLLLQGGGSIEGRRRP